MSLTLMLNRRNNCDVNIFCMKRRRQFLYLEFDETLLNFFSRENFVARPLGSLTVLYRPLIMQNSDSTTNFGTFC